MNKHLPKFGTSIVKNSDVFFLIMIELLVVIFLRKDINKSFDTTIDIKF